MVKDSVIAQVNGPEANFWRAVLIHLISAFIGFLLGSISTYIFRKIQRKKCKKIFSLPEDRWTFDKKIFRKIFLTIFNFHNGKTSYCVAVTAFEPDKNQKQSYTRPKTGYGELMALSNITRAVSYSYKFEKLIHYIHLSSLGAFSSYKLEENIIVIGGATHNAITRYFKQISEMKSKLRIHAKDEYDDDISENKDFHFFDVHTKERYQSEIEIADDGQHVKKDFGLITRVPNPLDKDKILLLVDGLHTFGLVAASKFFLPESIKKHYPTVNQLNDRYFQILISAHIKDYEAFITEVKYFPLNC